MDLENIAFIFNLTRLYSRLNSTTATGVDRLDIRYAKYVLDFSVTNDVFFVKQRKEIIILVSHVEARQIIESLWNRWISFNSPKTILRQGLINNYLEYFQCRIRYRLRRYVPKKLLAQLAVNRKKIVYLNSGHAGVQYYETHRVLKELTGCYVVFYLHDLIPIDFPEFCTSPNIRKVHEKRLKTIVDQADLVFVNSTHTKDRLVSYCNDYQYCIPKVVVNFIGVEDHIIHASSVKKKSLPVIECKLLPNQYYLYVSTIEPRKNHLMLLYVWLELSKRKQSNLKLVILGKRGWRNQSVIDLLDHSSRLSDLVVELNNATDSEMIALLQNAKALLYPSFDEGWGMPIAEALTLNTPVICSDLPVFKECSQNQAIYANPIDTVSWLNLISTGDFGDKVISYVPNTWISHFKQVDQSIGLL